MFLLNFKFHAPQFSAIVNEKSRQKTPLFCRFSNTRTPQAFGIKSVEDLIERLHYAKK